MQIQELNYKITVLLNSDAKSEVEGLRWVLTRRAAIAIASMAGEFVSRLSSMHLTARMVGHVTRALLRSSVLACFLLVRNQSADMAPQS